MPPREPRIARKYVVRGRVQGVGFRAFVEHCAELVGVSGYVRNLDDGAVEAHVQGTPRQVSEMAGFLRQGPRWSEVRGVEEIEVPMLQSDGFSIRH